MLTQREKREWTEVLNHNREALTGSRIFLQLWSDNTSKDPLACMQLGLAIILDKPIHIVVPHGARLPENIRRLATSIEYYDGTTKDIERATKSLLGKAGML